MDNEVETKKSVLPYDYRILPGDRIRIVAPSGAKLILHKSQVRAKLDGQDHPFRDRSAHETMMLETAWSLLEGK